MKQSSHSLPPVSVRPTSQARSAWRVLIGHGRYRWLLIAAVLATLLVALLPALPPYIIKRVIDEGVLARDIPRLTWLCGLYVIAVLSEFALSVLSQTLLTLYGQRTVAHLRDRLFAHMQRLPLAYFEREPKGKILTRLTSDVEALSEMFTSGAVTMLSDCLVAATIIVAMLSLSPKLTLISLLCAPPLVGLTEYFRRKARDAFRSIRARTAELNAFLSEHLPGLRTVLAFSYEARANQKLRQQNTALQESNKQAIWVDASLYAIIEAISSIAIAAMIWFCAQDTLRGALQIGVVVAFMQYLHRLFTPIRDLSSKLAMVQSGLTAAERTCDFLALPAYAAADPLTPLSEPAHADSAILPIVFDAVHFTYAQSAPQSAPPLSLVRGISFRVEPGQKIAIIGATGAGKTTLMKLLLHLIEPTSGAIYFGNNHTLSAATAPQLKRQIAMVPQDPVIFAATLRDNLTLFNHAISDAEIMQVLHALQIEFLLTRSEQGLDTLLDQRSAQLSAGEAQLIAFARALLKRPQLLILDEATSNIDALQEALVQKGLQTLLEGRAALIIAHRLKTLRRADEIWVLNQGLLQERGTHEALLAQEGLYRTLYNLQFSQKA